MENVSLKDMSTALSRFEFEDDAIILTHSSLKALGRIEKGALGVISSISASVARGTLVFPTLSQKNWSTVYEDWTLDRPSDVGAISEAFRTMEGSLRSDNETHSVSARGKNALDIVSGHRTGPIRWGIFGDLCFSENSPWQRMFESRERYGVRAYVLFWGVSMRYNTYKHFSEYRFVEELLSNIKDPAMREKIKGELHHYPYSNVTEDTVRWPFYSSFDFQETLLREGIARKTELGEGMLIAADIFDMVKRTDRALREDYKNMLKPHMAEWVERARAAANI